MKVRTLPVLPALEKGQVKILEVHDINATIKTIRNYSYPLRRPSFLMVPQRPKPGVKKFVDFVLSREGQWFISSRGVVSLLDLK